MNHLSFWIDVGGTFTDCIGSSSGRTKVLSSGVTKGRIDAVLSGNALVDPLRVNDSPDFWVGFQLRLCAPDGQTISTAKIVASDGAEGSLRLDRDILDEASIGLTYELSADLEAPILAIRKQLGLGLAEALPPMSIRLGTTRGTNALLTRSGARTAFVTTKGFGDILLIGNQDRPKLFELTIRKPQPLFVEAIEIDERIAAEGEVLKSPSEPEIRGQLQQLKTTGIESLAICLMHGYRYPRHERLVAELAREIGFAEISVSSEVSPLIKIVARGDTTVADAYLNPVLRTYLASLQAKLHPESDLRLLSSAGGLVSADRFTGKDSVLSGPAGGVVGFSKVAEAAGFSKSIGFDMGGTSTDVSRYDGRYELQYETKKAGVRLVTPMMAIETVAAGGGSICGFDGTRLVVGPQSAGADPGPACYGRGGPLAVTDINLYLGKILADYFPFQLDVDAVDRRLRSLCTEIEQTTGTVYTTIELADGFLKVANTNMANAIRSVSVAKGYDPRDYAMVAFGGAAPQHACAVADELGITTILNHPDNGVLSAYGIGLADIVRHQVAGVYEPLTEISLETLLPTFDDLEKTAVADIVKEGVPASDILLTRFLQLRYQGTDAALTVPFEVRQDLRDVSGRFEAEHGRLYGYVQERPLEIVSIRVEGIGKSRTCILSSEHAKSITPDSVERSTAYFQGKEYDTPIYRRTELNPGATIEGPAIIAEQISTTLIDPSWTAEVLSDHQLQITCRGVSHDPIRQNPVNPVQIKNDPAQLEIFNNQFTAIATQMGITLQQTAASVNVKERLDFSCALFTPTGNLVVNAPHIPVHLGAMSETVKCVIADNPNMSRGDVYVTNDPFRGGSHLPDVTVVTPVFNATGDELLFITANRAHHAEIGGITPGSMPPFSKNLAEEGVLIRNFKVVDGGESRLDALRDLLAGQGPYPSRNPNENIGDITAQIAANHQGARDLASLMDRYTYPVVRAYMDFIQDAATTKIRAAIHRLRSRDSEASKQTRQFQDQMDDGSVIAVTIELDESSMHIDFTGTAPVHRGNLNANRAIVTAAVLYVMRCMINEEIPLNQGVLTPIEITLPECMLNPSAEDDPAECAAMVGGNVETSQRIVDVLLGAIGLAAASQGTMNNLLFGDDTFGYYETICGGSGATAEGPGADAVHTHMTNTRLTDPEVLEHRFPVRLKEFSIRQNSGGQGHHPGGNGVTRQLEFLKPLTVSTLTQRRGTNAPFGLNGGQPASPGKNTHTKITGESESLPPQTKFNTTPNESITIQTPGGGGYGKI